MSLKVKDKSKKKANPYKSIRIGLIEKGTNFWRWAAQKEYPYTTVISAAKGERSGIVSVKIKRELEEFVNAE